YRTTIADPQNYLQVYVLNYDSLAGDWELVRPTSGIRVGSGRLSPAPGVVGGTPENIIQTSVTISQGVGFSGAINFLPVPYWPMRVHVPGSWREAPDTLMLYSDNASIDGLHYTVTSGQVEPTSSTLTARQHVPPAIRQSYLGFKSNVTGKLQKIARRVTKGKTNAFAKAVALEQWFLSSKFSYSLSSTSIPNSPAGPLDFLPTVRQGYCQQSAFAMAVRARLIGIPARIAIGYTAGHQLANGSWAVTTADAHAWPELYFSGAGWLRFEPTPGGAGGQQTAVEPSYVTSAVAGGGPAGGPHGPTTGPSSVPSNAATANIRGKFPQLPHGSVGTNRARPAAPPGGPILLCILAPAAAAPGTARVIPRRRRW